MIKPSKFFLVFSLLLLVCLGFIQSRNIALAATENEQVSLDEDIQASDLGIGEPFLLPDNPLYFLKNWGRSLRLFLTFDLLDKAELSSEFASERLIELKEMIKKGKDSQVIKEALEAYQGQVDKMKAFTENIREREQIQNRVDSFLDKFTQHQALHQRLLQKLENQVPADAFEKIKETREQHLERFKEVMLKLEEKNDIPERLEKNLESIKGGRFKDFKNLEFLEELKEKLPEDIQPKLEQTKEQILQRLRQKLEELSPEEQESLKQYLDQISGNIIKQLHVLGSLEGEELSERIEELVERARERYTQRIENQYQNTVTEQRSKEEINLAVESLQKAKSLITEKNIEKEDMPTVFKLLQESEEKLNNAKQAYEEEDFGRAFGQATASLALSKNAIRLIEIKAGFQEKLGNICAQIYFPVCGEDNQTYANICEAKMEEVKIAYRGECQTNIPCAQQGERVNRNPLLGSTAQVCCEGLEEIRITRSYSLCQEPDSSFECKTHEDCPLPRCPGISSRCVEGQCVVPRCEQPTICIQVITPAKNPITGQCKEFPTPCDIPTGWEKVNQCPSLELKLRQFLEKTVPRLGQ